jgi:hypothetical protein
MSPDEAAAEPAEPWRSFLRELDACLTGRVELRCFGGFVVAQHYGLYLQHVGIATPPSDYAQRLTRMFPNAPWTRLNPFALDATDPAPFSTNHFLVHPEPLAVPWPCAHEFIGEADGYLDTLAGIASAARVQGGAILDARIAAICRFHGVRELWSTDHDFSRFAVKVRNPLLAHAFGNIAGESGRPAAMGTCMAC